MASSASPMETTPWRPAVKALPISIVTRYARAQHDRLAGSLCVRPRRRRGTGKFEARAEAYESVPGLIEKLYLHYRNGDFGAVYVWEDEDALAAFRASGLGGSIAGAYKVEGGEVIYEVADVTRAVRPKNA